MARVFVVQQPRENKQGWTPNLEPATKYGAIHFIFQASERPTTDQLGAIFTASEALLDFDPDRDYVLNVPNGGDPNAHNAVMAVLMRKDIRKIKFLSWQRSYKSGVRDNRNGFYTPWVLTLPRPEYGS